jgi:hypothetical protein
MRIPSERGLRIKEKGWLFSCPAPSAECPARFGAASLSVPKEKTTPRPKYRMIAITTRILDIFPLS